MGFSIQQYGQLITIVMIAFCLGMDAFSLGVGLGMKRTPLYYLLSMVGMIGLLHAFMPWIGMYLGHYLSVHMKGIATIVGGGVLCLLGANMLLGVFRTEGNIQGFDMESLFKGLVVSLSVSIDSLSAGLSLGFLAVDRWLVMLLFGGTVSIMTAIGICLGKSMGYRLGHYGEVVGGMILLVLGSKFLW